MHTWLQDLRYSLRIMRKSPSFTAVIVLSLAIGIGANSAVFSVVDALLLHPLPYPDPSRVAAVWIHSPSLGILRDWPSPGQFSDLRSQNHSFEEMSLSRLSTWTLTGRGEPTRIEGMRTTSSLFHILGARPLLGRLLLPEDDAPGKPAVAVLSYAAWRRLFSADPKILGATIALNGNPFLVAGVLEPSFRITTETMPAEGPMNRADIFLPLPLDAAFLARRGDENYNILVRLKPGVTLSQAQADANVIASRIREKDKRDRSFGMSVTGLLDQVVGDVRRVLLVLLGAVSLVLLSACANVANLLLSRAAARDREAAVRAALGASWSRLACQLLTESVLLSLAGAAAGLVLAWLGLALLRALNPGNIPRLDEISINPSVLAFTFAVSLATGILFGLAPAWRALKVDLNSALKSGARLASPGAGLSLSRNRLRGLLVVSELSLSLVLLIGAGLLIRSFVRLQNVPPGFSPDGVLTLRAAVSGPTYRGEAPVIRFYNDAFSRIARLPGVLAASSVSSLPLTGTVGWGGINVEGFVPAPGQELQVDTRIASADYFRAMQIPLRRGRFFSPHDTSSSALVAIIDDRFAARFWPHSDPIGKHLWFSDPKKPFIIAGVVGSVKQYALGDEGKIAVYFSSLQEPDGQMYIAVRTASDPASLANPAGAALHAAEPAAVVDSVRPMKDLVHDSLARPRFAAALLAAFALFALILAAVGVYGVMSYLVTQSTHDLGVRAALGAQPSDLVSLILRRGLDLALLGVAIGLAASAAFTRALSSLLYGVSPSDPLTFAALALTLALIALLAAFIPARRASRTDPMSALRQD